MNSPEPSIENAARVPSTPEGRSPHPSRTEHHHATDATDRPSRRAHATSDVKDVVVICTERKLTPKQVVEELQEGSVLLCYEGPGKFCHRHVVAEWLERGTDVKVTELTFDQPKSEEPLDSVDEFFQF